MKLNLYKTLTLSIYLTVFLTLISFASCKNDRCACNAISNLGAQTITSIERSSSKLSAEATAEMDTEIKKIITIGIKGGAKAQYEDYDENVKTTVANIVDKFPDITNLQNFENDFYCRYINVICNDKSISDSKFNELKMSKLNTIHTLIQGLLLSKINQKSTTTTTPTANITNVRNKENTNFNTNAASIYKKEDEKTIVEGVNIKVSAPDEVILTTLKQALIQALESCGIKNMVIDGYSSTGYANTLNAKFLKRKVATEQVEGTLFDKWEVILNLEMLGSKGSCDVRTLKGFTLLQRGEEDTTIDLKCLTTLKPQIKKICPFSLCK